MATTAAEAKVGKVVQVIGPVVDVEFEGGHLPEIYSAVRITSDKGDAGDVIDTQKREVVDNLDALHNSRVAIEVVLRNGKPSYLLLHG